MKDLIHPSVLEKLPPIGHDPSTLLADCTLHLKLEDSVSGWKWYILEFDGDATFFGLIVNRIATVAGQFGLDELTGLSGADGGLRRDADFTPVTVAALEQDEPGIAELLAEPAPREVNARGLVDLE